MALFWDDLFPKPGAYQFQRREPPDGSWTHVGTAVVPELILTDASLQRCRDNPGF